MDDENRAYLCMYAMGYNLALKRKRSCYLHNKNRLAGYHAKGTKSREDILQKSNDFSCLWNGTKEELR